ncbi:MAG: hypothetical protein AAFS10_27060 [Myxococcota bacterium]
MLSYVVVNDNGTYALSTLKNTSDGHERLIEILINATSQPAPSRYLRGSTAAQCAHRLCAR